MDELSSAKHALRKSCHHLLKRANVVATGIGYKITSGPGACVRRRAE